MFLNIFSIFILLLIIGLFVYLFILLGALPGNIAQKRMHPQEQAIRACGWIGICTGGLLWILAIIWAYTISSKTEFEALKKRVDNLENKSKSR